MKSSLTLWKAEIRDPYSGGWVPVVIRVLLDPTKDGAVLKVQVENMEKHLVDAKPYEDV